MSQQTSVNPEALLLAEVSVPAFFQKLAADVGITPPDSATADSLIGTGNLVTNTVDLYLKKEASLKANGAVSAVKAATDAAFNAAGIFAKQAQEEPVAFLDVSGVRDAALLIVANGMKAAQDQQEKLKKAADVAAALNPMISKTDKDKDENEDEEKVVAAPKI